MLTKKMLKVTAVLTCTAAIGAQAAMVAQDRAIDVYSNNSPGQLVQAPQPSGLNESRYFVQFDLSAIPVGATINSATYSQAYTYYVGALATNTFSVLPVTAAWTAGTMTWETQPTVGSGTTVTNTPTTTGWGSYTITLADAALKTMVEGWVNTPATNNGIRLSLPSPTVLTFYQHGVPSLTIDYTPVVPEPGAAVLLAAGVIGLLSRRRRHAAGCP